MTRHESLIPLSQKVLQIKIGITVDFFHFSKTFLCVPDLMR